MRALFPDVLCAAVVMAVLGGCKNPSALDDLIKAIARSQGVDESTVHAVLQSEARSADEQLRLAQIWKSELPSRPIPDLASEVNKFDLDRAARDELRAAACGAVGDMLTTGQVPSAETFAADYLTGLTLRPLPAGELYEIGQEFEELWEDASAGTLTSTDVRLTFMQIQYCSRL